jgi:peroxin-3
LGEDDTIGDKGLPADVENKHLTTSWWQLHARRKDVGERIRRGVEEVFERFVALLISTVKPSGKPDPFNSVSLNITPSIMDLHRLANDFQRPAKHEATFGGAEHSIK